jgi:hypothetical protein
MSDKCQILRKTKSNTIKESLGKNPLKIRLRKSKQKGGKKAKTGEWCPCSQADRAPVRGMVLCRRLWGGPVS